MDEVEEMSGFFESFILNFFRTEGLAVPISTFASLLVAIYCEKVGSLIEVQKFMTSHDISNPSHPVGFSKKVPPCRSWHSYAAMSSHLRPCRCHGPENRWLQNGRHLGIFRVQPEAVNFPQTTEMGFGRLVPRTLEAADGSVHQWSSTVERWSVNILMDLSMYR